MFKHFKCEVENQFNKKIKVIISDKNGDNDLFFDEFYSEHGIIHQTMCSYSL